MTRADAEVLARTRSAVLNVLLVAGLLIALSGWALRSLDRGATLWPPDRARRVAFGVLLGLVAASLIARRAIGRRPRPARFFQAHLAAAILGALAVPLGFVYGYAVAPTLDAVAPFWVAGLALGFLALPRRAELADGNPDPNLHR